MDPGALAALGERVVVEPDKTLVVQRVAELLALPAASAAVRSRTGRGFGRAPCSRCKTDATRSARTASSPTREACPARCRSARFGPRRIALMAAGAREIVLTGINIGRYGDGEAGLSAVVEAVAASGVERLRLSSIEPLDLTPEFLGVLSDARSFCPHLHVPLQSGSDAVLSAMGRRYTVAEYAERIAAAREALPGLAVTTDILSGFPGETEWDAEETLRFCEASGFSSLHVFRFSARPGTLAATMPGPVPARVAAARAARLRACGNRLRAAHIARRLGEEACVLVESAGADGTGRGTSEDYLRVGVSDAATRLGQTVHVCLELDSEGALSGRPKPGAC